ncbi:4087_t:CDS:2 [Entrophospora sp. SA101]|nr:4087_t:CDS:2 [Entrophospora sp. SA101]
MPYAGPAEDNNNITISSSYNASNIETTSRHKFSSSFQPEFLTASSRRKSAPEFLKPLLIPQKNFQHEDDQLIIIKKKNGDIVKPSLKKRSKSEPNTPILPKYVHFNADLEQIRLFREAQEPQAVKPELTITLPNMPPITTLHSSKPVYVDSIFLSRNKNKLQGRIMVQNIAFHKLVEVRYTFDFWQTVSEVKATYAEGVAEKDKDSFDVFIFSIELFDNSRNPIDGKTMYFAVHYNVSNRDYWDNNSGSNYRVNFKKVKKSSSSSQGNHHCHQNNNINNQGSLPIAIATNSSSSRKWPIIPSTPVNHLPKKSLSYDCHSPPNSNTRTSIADSRKNGVAGRYDIGVSLSAAQNIPLAVPQRSINGNCSDKGSQTYKDIVFKECRCIRFWDPDKKLFICPV